LIERAQIELSWRRLEALQSGKMPPIADPLFAVEATVETPHLIQNSAVHSDKTVRDLITHFEEWKSPKVTQSRMAQYRLAIRAMQEQWGENKKLAAITRQHCQELVALFPRVPPYVVQHYKGMTLAAAVEVYERKQGNSADRFAEAQNHLSALREILQRAVQQDWIAINPAAKVEAPGPRVVRRKYHEKGNGFDPFSLDDLKQIFSAPLYTGCVDDERHFNEPGSRIVRRHRFWPPLIALWTGARLGEVLQLEKADVRYDESGIWYLAITDEEAGEYDPKEFQKRVKNKNSIRDIPIHSELRRLGFVSWVSEQPDGRLFPEAQAAKNGKLSDVYSKWFKRFLEFQGVWVQRRKVFHSFRNSFNDALREAKVPVEFRKAINGWSSQEGMDTRYGRGHKVHRLAEHVEKVTYEGLDLSHLYPSDPS
jgi:integrase